MFALSSCLDKYTFITTSKTGSNSASLGPGMQRSKGSETSAPRVGFPLSSPTQGLLCLGKGHPSLRLQPSATLYQKRGIFSAQV